MSTYARKWKCPNNLLGKLFYVYEVWDHDEDQNPVTECLITQSHDNYLGHSVVRGIFSTEREAQEFCDRLPFPRGGPKCNTKRV